MIRWILRFLVITPAALWPYPCALGLQLLRDLSFLLELFAADLLFVLELLADDLLLVLELLADDLLFVLELLADDLFMMRK